MELYPIISCFTFSKEDVAEIKKDGEQLFYISQSSNEIGMMYRDGNVYYIVDGCLFRNY